MSAAFLGILFTSFGVLLQALYLSRTWIFCWRRRCPSGRYLWPSCCRRSCPTSADQPFGLPVLFGLGFSQGYNWLYYPLVIVVLCALALAAAGISSLLVIGMVRLFSARRVAEILGFLGAIMTMVCSQSGQLARFNDMNAAPGAGNDRLATRYNTPWLPLAWAGRGLVALGMRSGVRRITEPGCHPGIVSPNIYRSPDHSRETVLYRLGQHADRAQRQKSRPASIARPMALPDPPAPLAWPVVLSHRQLQP